MFENFYLFIIMNNRILHDKAEQIILSIRSPAFSPDIIEELKDISKKYDGNRTYRFDWMISSDINVLSAIATHWPEVGYCQGKHMDVDKK